MAFCLAGVAKVLLAVQAAYGSVAGTVRDGESEEPLAEAVVSLTDLGRVVTTDATGRYLFREVPAGPQHLVVRRIGYAPRTLHALVPPQGTVEINITLRPQPIVLAAIEGRSAVPVSGLDDDDRTTFPDRGLSTAAVRHHPLLAEADVLQALGGGEVVVHPEAPSGIHVRGGASDQIAYLLDGIPTFSPYHAAGAFSSWNPDALSRLQLVTASRASAFADALSGVVAATTRTPGPRFQAQGGVSITQARVTIDGPVGWVGAGYLLSGRSTFPGLLAPKAEPSYLRGEAGDWLAKLESPLGGGRIRLLAYGSDNEIDAAAATVSEVASASEVGEARNAFAWHSRSLGAAWTRQLGRAGVHVRAWSAVGDGSAVWSGQDSTRERLAAARRDDGLLATVELSGSRKSTVAGIRTQWGRTSYRLLPVAGEGRLFMVTSRTPVSAAFVQHARSVTGRAELEVALAGAVAAGDVHLGPRAELRWRPLSALSLYGGYARTHQFAQSLRNPESVVSRVFPVDLHVGTGASRVPVARSDQGIVAVEYRPAPGIRLGAQAYARHFDDLVLVAAKDAGPFASSGFVVGWGDARGVSFEVGANGARYGVVASYGLQHVHLKYADTSYVPDFGATHSINAGAIVFPSATFSIRLGASGMLGRRTTALSDPLEWEACNLLDQGCEFAGSPQHRLEPLGSTPLPAYLRVDLGIRKHWHLTVAGQDGLIAVFGTVTNVLGRRNVLTVVADPATGERGGIEARPRAPLVVGIDWRF